MDEINYSEPASSKKKLSKRLIFFGVFFIVILGLVGGLYYFLSSGSTQEEPKTISIDEGPSETDTDEATPTPEAEVDRSEFSLTVQNGSGVAGAAGGVSDTLEALGYEIASTGNANNFDYEDITIQVKEGEDELLELLEADLSKDYTVGDTSATLSANLTYDALVIVGK